MCLCRQLVHFCGFRVRLAPSLAPGKRKIPSNSYARGRPVSSGSAKSLEPRWDREAFLASNLRLLSLHSHRQIVHLARVLKRSAPGYAIPE
jgi:hypothetical protein